MLLQELLLVNLGNVILLLYIMIKKIEIQSLNILKLLQKRIE